MGICRRPASRIAALAALLLVVGPLAASGRAALKGLQFGQNAPQPVRWALELDPADTRVKAGGTTAAVVTASIDEGWHVYAPDPENPGPRPVSIGLASGSVFQTDGDLEYPEPEREMDEALGQVTSSYSGQAVFRLPLKVGASVTPGSHPLTLEVVFQACDGRMCLPPRTVKLEQPVTIVH